MVSVDSDPRNNKYKNTHKSEKSISFFGVVAHKYP